MLISLNLDWIRRDWWIWVMYYCSPVALIVVVRRWSLLLVVDMIWNKRGHPALPGLGSSAVYCTMPLSLTCGPRDHRVHLSVKKSRCRDWDLNPPCPALHFTADVLCWKQRRKKRTHSFKHLGYLLFHKLPWWTQHHPCCCTDFCFACASSSGRSSNHS